MTLRSGTVTIPAGQRQLIVVRLTSAAKCLAPVGGLEAHCGLRIRIGGAPATPDYFEFVGTQIVHAVAARGPLPAGTHAVLIQGAPITGLSRLSLPHGNLVEIDQIRVD